MSRIFIRRGAALFRLFTALFIAIAMSAAPAAADAPKGPVSSSTVSINGQAFQLKSGVAFYRADWPGAPVVINLLFTDNTSLVFSVPNRSG
ncbi:MAG TPA: hypothetical protein PK585_12160, partial [Amphiplicatus sp.]|nr:hypothetical protein [Amphiplicatus sp.]